MYCAPVGRAVLFVPFKSHKSNLRKKYRRPPPCGLAHPPADRARACGGGSAAAGAYQRPQTPPNRRFVAIIGHGPAVSRFKRARCATPATSRPRNVPSTTRSRPVCLRTTGRARVGAARLKKVVKKCAKRRIFTLFGPFARFCGSRNGIETLRMAPNEPPSKCGFLCPEDQVSPTTIGLATPILGGKM